MQDSTLRPDRTRIPNRRSTLKALSLFGSLRVIGQPTRMNAWRAISLTAPLGLGGLAACQRLIPPRDLKAPELQVSGLRIEGLQRGDARVALTLVAFNPNPVELPLSQVQFDIRLFGQLIGNGRVDEASFVLPAQGARELPVTLNVSGSDLGRALRRGLGERIAGNSESRGTEAPADWQIAGSLRWGDNPLALEFRKQGRLGG